MEIETRDNGRQYVTGAVPATINIIRATLHTTNVILLTLCIYHAFTTHWAWVIGALAMTWTTFIKWTSVRTRGTWMWQATDKPDPVALIFAAVLLLTIPKSVQPITQSLFATWLILAMVHDYIFFKKFYPLLKEQADDQTT